VDLRWRLRVRRRNVKTAASQRKGKAHFMALGGPVRRKEPLHVPWMALALALAAFLGGAAGLLWHALDFGGNAIEEPATPATG
jgi:hypothetical protein